MIVSRPRRGRRFVILIATCLTTMAVSQGQAARDKPSVTPSRAPAIPSAELSNLEARPVRSIADARTVVVLVDGKERRIGLLGVDEPSSEAEGDASRRCLEGLLRGEQVYLVYETGGDSLAESAYLYRAPDGLFVNLEMIRQGYAAVAARPKFEHRELFRQYEARAREYGRGVWLGQVPGPRGTTPTATSKPTGDVREARKAAESAEALVYVTRSGKKYHLRTCKHAGDGSQSLTIADAAAKGYEPCSSCKPPRR